VICKRNSDSVPDRDKMFDPSKASTSILWFPQPPFDA
jgi:hypothetical protein